MDAIEAIRTRRSLRQLAVRAVPRVAIDELLALAGLAPAPHHTRPWRFVVVGPERREALASAMGAAWRADLERDGHDGAHIARLLARSRRQIVDAPALVLACLTHEGLRQWPDARRQRHEWAMAQHSLGAALQNIMLAAHARGLASYWISAPLFAPDAARAVLDLPDGWSPQAFVVVGYPRGGAAPRPRPPLDPTRLVADR
jgi:coenzyme F420-0:L-glutamate ligase/coenzyme F420-1:gamma-L-glutamate ligase